MLNKATVEDLNVKHINGFDIHELNELNCDKLVMSEKIEDIVIHGLYNFFFHFILKLIIFVY